MNCVFTGSGSPQEATNLSLSSGSFTVSGDSGATTVSSSLSALATPPLSSFSFCSGSGLSPMDLFEYQVCHRWTLNFGPEEGAAFNATFQEMQSNGNAYLTGYSYQELRDMNDRGMILWGEAEIQEQKLRGVTLPLDPGYDLSGSFKGPTIFVRQPDDNNRIVIMNGNHRVAKVLGYGAPITASICVLELASPQASEELLGTAPIGGYANPRMPEAFHYTLNSTYTG